jgi:hypothetical protein
LAYLSKASQVLPINCNVSVIGLVANLKIFQDLSFTKCKPSKPNHNIVHHIVAKSAVHFPPSLTKKVIGHTIGTNIKYVSNIVFAKLSHFLAFSINSCHTTRTGRFLNTILAIFGDFLAKICKSLKKSLDELTSFVR